MATTKKRPTAKASTTKATKKKTTAKSSSTRTSSRSAKRRSPKDPPEDPARLEVERLEFLRAMDRYKRKTGKTFPSWSEVLEVLRTIGWVSPTLLAEMREDLKS